MVFTEAQTLGRCRQPCSAMVHADAGLGSTGMPSSSGYPNDRLRFCGRPPCHAPCPKHVLGRRYARRGEHMDAASPRTCSACVAAPLSRLSRVQTTTACLPSADVVKPAWHVGRNVGRARWVSAFSRAWLCRDTSQERTANGDVVLVAVVLHDGDVVADAHERLVLVGLLEDLEEVSGRRRPAAARPCRARVLRKRLKKNHVGGPGRGARVLGQRHGHGQGDALEERGDVRHEADLVLQLVRHLAAAWARALEKPGTGASGRAFAPPRNVGEPYRSCMWPARLYGTRLSLRYAGSFFLDGVVPAPL